MSDHKCKFRWEDEPDVCGECGVEFVLFLNGVKLWANVHLKNYPPEESWSGEFVSPTRKKHLFIKIIKGKKELAMKHLICRIKNEINRLGGDPATFIKMQPTKADRRRMYGLPVEAIEEATTYSMDEYIDDFYPDHRITEGFNEQ